MRLLSTLRWGVALGVVAYFAAAAPAIAQGGAAPAPDAQVGFQKKTQLTPDEQLTEAQRRVARMTSQSTAIRKQLQTARQARDVVKTLCLNYKLSQSDVATRAATERVASLKSAVNRNDADAANHEYTVLAVLAQRSEQIGSEANQCAGEESAFVGDTQVKTTIDPNVAPEEANFPTFPGFPVTPPPPCVSCVR
ncbi:MAG: hypothetical protein JNM74_24410 [Myxococcales bacterium]|nr:hypothetical protein [Myxococcales bacterium]